MEKIKFWDDREKGLVPIKLLSDTAEKFSKLIADDNNRTRKMNKRTQIRKFYDEVMHLDMEARRRGKNPDDRAKKWNAILALVNMLVAKAAYARGRDLVSDNFLGFIKDSVADIKDPDDLKIFASFFEAFMGFYRLYGPNS